MATEVFALLFGKAEGSREVSFHRSYINEIVWRLFAGTALPPEPINKSSLHPHAIENYRNILNPANWSNIFQVFFKGSTILLNIQLSSLLEGLSKYPLTHLH
jgi:hypothetical protein